VALSASAVSTGDIALTATTIKTISQRCISHLLSEARAEDAASS
jgi:hypothetical protein